MVTIDRQDGYFRTQKLQGQQQSQDAAMRQENNSGTSLSRMIESLN